jgi:putative prophage muMc02, head decoration protein
MNITSGLGVVASSVQSTAGGKSKRFAFICLPYELKDYAIPREIIVDYETGHIYFKNTDGVLKSKTKDLETILNSFLGKDIDVNKAGNNLTIDVEGLTSKTIGTALVELLKKIIKEREQSPYKANVRVASTKNIYPLSGLINVDGVDLQEGDRILLKDQTNASENGIYVVKNGSWEKPSDYNEETDLQFGMTTLALEGTRNGGYLFALRKVRNKISIEQITRDKLTTDGNIEIDSVNREIKLADKYPTEETGNYITRDKKGRIKTIEDLKTLNVILNTDDHSTYKKQQIVVDRYNSNKSIKLSTISGLNFEGTGNSKFTVMRDGEDHLLPISSAKAIYLSNDGLALYDTFNNKPVIEGNGDTDKLLTIYVNNPTSNQLSYNFTLEGETIDNEPFKMDIFITAKAGQDNKIQLKEITSTERTTYATKYNNSLCIDIRNLKRYKLFNKFYYKSLADQFVEENNRFMINKYSEVSTNTIILPAHTNFNSLMTQLFTTVSILPQTVKLNFAKDEQVNNMTPNMTTGENVIIDLKRLSKFYSKINTVIGEIAEKTKDATYTNKGIAQLTNNINDAKDNSKRDILVPSIKLLGDEVDKLRNIVPDINGEYDTNNKNKFKLYNKDSGDDPSQKTNKVAITNLKTDTTDNSSAITYGDHKAAIDALQTAIGNVRNSLPDMSKYPLKSDYINANNINAQKWYTAIGITDKFKAAVNLGDGVIADNNTETVNGGTIYRFLKVEKVKVRPGTSTVNFNKKVDEHTLIFVDSLLANYSGAVNLLSGTIDDNTEYDPEKYTITGDGDYGIYGNNRVVFNCTFDVANIWATAK